MKDWLGIPFAEALSGHGIGVLFFCACPEMAGLVYEKAWDTTMIRLRGTAKNLEYRKQLRPRLCAGEQTDFPLYSFEI